MTAAAPAVCLVILDGWGLAKPGPGNAVELANTPVFDALWQRYPHTELTASGRAVGLPEGQMGNSEVGHLNLGAGAVIRQDLTRIDDAVADGEFDENPVLVDAMRSSERLHLIGLVSDGGVHSSIEHLRELIRMAADLGVEQVFIHAFSDGRDSDPHGAERYLEQVDGWCAAAGNARVASVVGRFFAMDRDRRWERVQVAWDLLAAGRAEHRAEDAPAAARAAYERGETDEFIAATVVGDGAVIEPGDSVIAFNFRPDRMRELTRALCDPAFDDVERAGAAPVTTYTCLTEYEEGWPYPVAFAPERPLVTLPQVIAAAGGRQLHVAETEKYPHVTYFFAGGDEHPQQGERRELVPSRRDVATYDESPEMSAEAAADVFLAAWNEAPPQFAIINFANPDMVGHTGVVTAAVEAIETVDRCLGRIVEAVAASGGELIITADHGNAEQMINQDGSPNTAHSLNLVPLIVTREGLELRGGGILADVAPTALELLGIEQPPAITGSSLISG
ncbi:MAG: 2,3-bisphosphoglycerate-independent phosphoglycerate mutase [Actinobacteria bacterium]|uniref:phosphoglycerate mutase (2,3-diphosphoglycerate-independent) n=1 Tax=freshwater metagenome TaxID=449393 RepID=A0A6J5ZWT8_9ZZZZ|nr:2,3-bisphosphoglycerate-independent phosphoglycerate mutase [Actinomycetota bacterium]